MIRYFWPTPIYECELENPQLSEIQKEFLDILKNKKETDSFSDPWNDNRIQVTDNFKVNLINEYALNSFKNKLNICIEDFLKGLNQKILDYNITDCWMTKSLKNNYGHIHNHMPSDISGVYYVKTLDGDGDIFFENPLQISYSSMLGVNSIFHPSYCSKSKVGKLILFPGWINHGINTNKTDFERVSVSFNIKFKV